METTYILSQNKYFSVLDLPFIFINQKKKKNHGTEAIHHSCTIHHVIQFQSPRTWTSTLEIQPQYFIFSRASSISERARQ